MHYLYGDLKSALPYTFFHRICKCISIDLYREHYNITACIHDGTDRENFSVNGTTGVTWNPNVEDWNYATFSSQREPYCAGYQSFLDYVNEECPKSLNLTVLVYLLFFYLIYMPLRGYFIYKIH